MLGRVARQFLARLGQGLGHLGQDVQAAFVGLLHGLAHDVGGQAGDLDVHLHAGDAFGGTGDLEVHVAQGVFIAQDVGEHDELVAFLDQAHGHTGHRGADGDTGIHEGEAAAAHGSHGRGAVGFHGLGDHAHGEGEVGVGRHDGTQGLLGQGAVADLATGDAHGLHFAHAEGREVVMQHEALGHVAAQAVHALFIGGGAQGGHHQGLGLAAAEDGRTVGAGQHAGLDLDGAHGLGVAAVDAHAFVDDAGTHDLLFQVADDLAHFLQGFALGPGGVIEQGFHDLVLDGLTGVLAGQLFGHAQGFFDAGLAGQFLHAGHQHRIVLMGGEGHLFLAGQFAQLELGVDERLDLLAAPFQSVDDDVFGHEGGFAFHHGQGIAGSGEHDVQVAALLLFKGGVEHELTVDAADAATGHRAFERQGREHDGGGSAGQGQHVGLVLLVGGDDAGQHLHVFVQALGEQGTDGTVDEAGDQGLTLGGTADLAAEEAAGDTAGGVHLFGIFHGEGEEALVELQSLGADGHQHHRAAALHPDGAVGLVGQTAGLENDFLAAHGGRDAGRIEDILVHVDLV